LKKTGRKAKTTVATFNGEPKKKQQQKTTKREKVGRTTKKRGL